MHEDQQPDHMQIDHTKRDSESFLILGGFLSILATLVLIATLFESQGHSRIVNLAAGLTLMAIGLGMAARGYVLRHRGKR